jgi:hypothetical protein
MTETTLDDIRQKALHFHESGQKWHFHIMSPTCVFNKKKQFAFVLESAATNEAYVFYSDKAEKELGQELAPLLHGVKVLDATSVEANYVPSPNVQRVIERAKQLNEKGVSWHHHMLFPDCVFNANSPSYALIFEDPEAGSTLESLTDSEPTNDLKQIESLFYKK